MQSRWYEIAQAVVEQCKLAAAAAGAGCLDNPPLPLDAKALQAPTGLFVLHRGDKVLDQPGQLREKRRVRVVVGALALTTAALKDADALHFAARLALRSDAFRAALRATGEVGPVREVELDPELRDIATPGSTLMSAFEIDYFQSYTVA